MEALYARQSLSLSENIVLTSLEDAAARGTACPTNEDLAELLGFTVSAPPGIITRLEQRGLIAVRRFQKERQVTIVATGMSTAPVRTPAPHWRDRPRDVPAPSVQVIASRRPDTAREIVAAAHAAHRSPADFLADLVWIGWSVFHEREIQTGASEGLV